jgi:hypothetical protein
MRLFTVKDFITNYSSCLACNRNSKIKISSFRPDEYVGPKEINLAFSKSYADINLKISYRNSLQLRIYYITNKFETSDDKMLKKYTDTHSIQLVSRCWIPGMTKQPISDVNTVLHTFIVSDCINFDYNKSRILPFKMEEEMLCIWDTRNVFNIHSDYEESKTIINIAKLKSPENFTIVNSSVLKLPLMNIYKFKTKKHLLDKLNIYLTFL